MEPAFEAVDRAAAACGVDLGSLLSEPELDPQQASLIETSLSLSVAERLERLMAAVAFVEAARASVVPA